MIPKNIFIVVLHYDAFEQKIECVCDSMKEATNICRRMNKRYATRAIINEQYDYDLPDDYDWLGDEQYYNWEEYSIIDSKYHELTHPFIPDIEKD